MIKQAAGSYQKIRLDDAAPTLDRATLANSASTTSYQKFRLGEAAAKAAPSNSVPTDNVFQKGHSFCPCCSDVLLRHINRSGVYQLCRRCRQEMPDLKAIQIQHCNR